MGFLDRLREAQREPIHEAWNHLHSREEFSAILEKSNTKPQIIFKHSTRCGISSMAKHQLEHEWDLHPDRADMHYLDLIAYRDTSNRIAEKLKVIHQSPQVILIHQGKSIYQASHHAISVGGIKNILSQLEP